MKERWVAAAFTTDALVAELLLRLKHSASSDSSHASPPPTTSTTTTTTTTSLNPVGWGDRKSRSKPSNTTAFSLTNGFGKGQQQRSPSTPLSWSGGGAPSTSDGCDESSRRSDLSVGDRYTKVEGSTTYIHDKSRKRKIDLHQDPKKNLGKFESEMEIRKRRVMLPDLNETPAYEELGGL
ncbi:hypothetical protein L1887_19625 [Cichorium endivia]|nr:hypothetical protein L1887_19625 [Cichorium endivia]